jgi:glutamate 5-kinase
MTRKDYLKDIKRLVVKVGTSTLTFENGLLNLSRIDKLVRELANLQNKGYEVILVTSGALGAGMGSLGLKERPRTLPDKQAVSSVGQVALIHLYQKLFSEYGKQIGQLLLTMGDISNRERYLNARNSCLKLISMGIIPVINENDSVAVDEIKVGDNDTLSAFVSTLVDADLLLILSDIDGLYTSNPKTDPEATLIETVTEINDHIRSIATGAGSNLGTGGMATKISAAEIVTLAGIPMIITKGFDPSIIGDIMDGKEIGTLFLETKMKLNARKHWITYETTKKGTIIIDSGALNALKNHNSLLSIGIIKCEGEFHKGEVVSICDNDQNEVAVGISNYSQVEVDLIKGKNSSEIIDILRYNDYDEIIHIDNMFIF